MNEANEAEGFFNQIATETGITNGNYLNSISSTTSLSTNSSLNLDKDQEVNIFDASSSISGGTWLDDPNSSNIVDKNEYNSIPYENTIPASVAPGQSGEFYISFLEKSSNILNEDFAKMVLYPEEYYRLLRLDTASDFVTTITPPTRINGGISTIKDATGKDILCVKFKVSYTVSSSAKKSAFNLRFIMANSTTLKEGFGVSLEKSVINTTPGQVSHTWYKINAGTKSVYIQKPEDGETSFQARVSENSSSTALVYSYIGGQWISDNTYASIPGTGGGVGVASVLQSVYSAAYDPTYSVSGIGDFINDIVIDVTAKAYEIQNAFLDYMGFDPDIMTQNDWEMVTLGISAGIVETTFPERSVWNPVTVLFNKDNVKSLLLIAAGIRASEADSEYYFLQAKTYTEYGIMIASKIIEAGSYTAAIASLENAGISASGGLLLFVGTGGTSTPISIVIEIEAAEALVASGVCALAGVAVGKVSENAKNVFNADRGKLGGITPPPKWRPSDWWVKQETGKYMNQILSENGWTKSLDTRNGAYEVWNIFDSNGNKIGRYDKGHRSYDGNTGKYRVTASHYHLDTDIPAGNGNVHYITID